MAINSRFRAAAGDIPRRDQRRFGWEAYPRPGLVGCQARLRHSYAEGTIAGLTHRECPVFVPHGAASCRPVIRPRSAMNRVPARPHGWGIVQAVTEGRRDSAPLAAPRPKSAGSDSQRLERLLEVAGALAVATMEDQVGHAVVDAGVEAMDATLGGFWRIDPSEHELVLVRSRGFLAQHQASFARVAHDANSPLTDAVRKQSPVWLASRAEYAGRYPTLEEGHRPAEAGPLAFGVAPILVAGEPVGVLAFVFHDESRLTSEARTYIQVLASHAGHALQRIGLHVDLVEALETGQAMIRSFPAAVMLLDADGVVRSWNPAAERMFGWRAEEVIGRFLPAISGDQRGQFLDDLKAVIAGAATSAETVRRTRDGTDIEVLIERAPVRRTGGVSCLAVVLDISERKRIERGRKLVAEAGNLLTTSLDWERTIPRLAAIPVPALADWCAVYLLENDQLICLTRTGESDPSHIRQLPHRPGFGTVSTAIASGHAEIMADIDDAARQRVARNPEHLAELRNMGMRSYLAVPMRTGRIVGALAFGARTRNFDAVDVTIGEGLAARAAGAIENAGLYREATRARAEAEAANRAKDEFLAMLGHELRNPLAPITTALALMAMRDQAASRERQVIERQVAHLGRLVEDLLDVSRITRGRLDLDRRHVAVADVVSRSVELASPLLERRQHQLILDVPADLAVDGDPTRLAQIMSNLLTNSGRYTPQGGRIEVRARRDGDDVVLQVADNGAGIEPDALSTIFDTFVQGRQSLARTEGGLGLGLSIVKGLVTAHGGSVAARSGGLGRGSTFEVRLPMVTSRAPVARSSAGGAAGPVASRHRVLVVDDNRDAADLLASLLDTAGHESRVAYDGPAALDLADKFEPEIGLLDIGLPTMDGFELARRLRANPRLRGMRLIAVTGYARERDRERARAAGFDDHLAKPVSLKDLQRAFSSPAGLAALRRE